MRAIELLVRQPEIAIGQRLALGDRCVFSTSFNTGRNVLAMSLRRLASVSRELVKIFAISETKNASAPSASPTSADRNYTDRLGYSADRWLDACFSQLRLQLRQDGRSGCAGRRCRACRARSARARQRG